MAPPPRCWYHGAFVAMPEAGGRPRLRRARRKDIPSLLRVVGGPEAGRERALKRVLKTFAADVYVLDRDRHVAGVVAVFYRRSLREGGLVATIDALESFAADAGGIGAQEQRADLDVLLAHALERARRRGCVAVRASAATEPLASALVEQGFREEALLQRAITPLGTRRGEEARRGADLREGVDG